MIDLDTMSLKDLKTLQRDVGKAIDTYEERQKLEALEKVDELAKSLGYDLKDLAEVAPMKSSRKAVAPKYCNPADPEQTWSGRGRKPKWFEDALAEGKAPEDLLI